MFNLKPIALVSGTVICAVGFFLFIPLITELIYKTETWQSYAVPISVSYTHLTLPTNREV